MGLHLTKELCGPLNASRCSLDVQPADVQPHPMLFFGARDVLCVIPVNGVVAKRSRCHINGLLVKALDTPTQRPTLHRQDICLQLVS